MFCHSRKVTDTVTYGDLCKRMMKCTYIYHVTDWVLLSKNKP